ERGLTQLREEVVRAARAHLERAARAGAAGGLTDRARANAAIQQGDLAREYGLADDAGRRDALATADRHYQDAENLLGRPGAAEPASDLARGNLAVALERRGQVCLLRGDAAGAKGLFERALALRQEVVERPAAAPGSAASLRPADTRA